VSVVERGGVTGTVSVVERGGVTGTVSVVERGGVPYGALTVSEYCCALLFEPGRDIGGFLLKS